MGQTTLVAMQIDGGQALLAALRQAGFDVTVGGWVQASDDEGDWTLYLASQEVEDHGIAEAYKTIYTILQAHPQFGIDPFAVKLIEPRNPIALDLLALQTAAPRVPRSRPPKLGALSVEETYVYAS